MLGTKSTAQFQLKYLFIFTVQYLTNSYFCKNNHKLGYLWSDVIVHFLLMFNGLRMSSVTSRHVFFLNVYCFNRVSLSMNIYSLTEVSPIICTKRHGAYRKKVDNKPVYGDTRGPDNPAGVYFVIMTV